MNVSLWFDECVCLHIMWVRLCVQLRVCDCQCVFSCVFVCVICCVGVRICVCLCMCLPGLCACVVGCVCAHMRLIVGISLRV